ncbi:MAG: hypothetical protein HOO93_11315 [Methyloglobulus sp.]|nr:hypothetical protein [Methyloglobulus sp.]
MPVKALPVKAYSGLGAMLSLRLLVAEMTSYVASMQCNGIEDFKVSIALDSIAFHPKITVPSVGY